MRGVLSIALALLAMLCVSLPSGNRARGAEPVDPAPQNEQLLVAGGAIFPAGTLIAQPLHTKDGQVAGKINDLVFDLEQGRLAFVILSGDRNVIGSDDQFLLPAPVMSDLSSNKRFTLPLSTADLEAAPRAEDAHTIKRKEAATIYEHFALQPYWNEKRDGTSASDVFVPLSLLKKMAVQNSQDKKLGEVRDVALTPRGMIAYVGLVREGADDVIYPVPLSAFVAPHDPKHWVLELPEKVLEETPTFPPTAWPATLDRGWLEYVAVRYGQPAIGGINHELKADADKAGKKAAE